MNRETGYYWVKRLHDPFDGIEEWEIAYYEVLGDRNIWTLMWFDDLEFQDDAFVEINENRIKNPDEIGLPYRVIIPPGSNLND